MEILYANQKIEELFSDLDSIASSRNLLQKQIGLMLSKKAKLRMNQLKAAETFQKYLDFHIGNPHSLKGGFAKFYGVDLDKHTRLII